MNENLTEVKGYTDSNLNGLSVTPEVILQWIKDTLEDASYFQVPGTVANIDKRDILRQFRIDREQLNINGLPERQISRLYRCLFVYSVGFNELLKSLLSYCKDKVSLTASVWKVFTVLLEYSCKVEYKAIINQQIERHNEELKKLDKINEESLKEYKEEIEELKLKIEELQKYSNQ